jgi:hypothetical protein
MKTVMLRRVDKDGELYIRGKIQCRTAMCLIRAGELEMRPKSGWISSAGGAGFVRRRKPRMSWADAARYQPEDELA